MTMTKKTKEQHYNEQGKIQTEAHKLITNLITQESTALY